MQRKYILSVLVIILMVCLPVAATTNKIAAGAPVFIGESNLVITSAIKDCHVIAWWADEGNMTGPADKNLTVKQLNEGAGLATHFNVSPDIFEGHAGNWYCEDVKPTFVVLRVLEPNLTIRVWDTDNDMDVTGQSVPISTNVTYRIDTNLDQAMVYYNRTDLTPLDGIFTIKLIDPSGKQISNFYTGSVGATTTEILSFDSTPFISTPIYMGKKMGSWNHLARDGSGSLLYPAGTYTFTVSQNLNNMQGLLTASGADLNGKTTASASVTFLPQESFTSATVSTVQTEPVATVPETAEPTKTIQKVTIATTVPVTTKTTYSPLPAWITVVGLVGAGLLVAKKMP
ncbi:DUF3821 domain-containing protein [Methanoregula sp.]|uniref:DUF3821 domain-containing protein n=1 Tax=Methanoregula sp. TaxID=2052170 RepID=UPI00236A020B|nr:DUF3821 domain-containing protein [Methanoregula sp.]MDD1686860.1 DUF3821 domain-containing protein [Methanoregula sp.]